MSEDQRWVISDAELETQAARAEMCEEALLHGQLLRNLIHGNVMLRELMRFHKESRIANKPGETFDQATDRRLKAKRGVQDMLGALLTLDKVPPDGEVPK